MSNEATVEGENQPTIFLVEEDDETRPILKKNLQRYGYRVIVALDEEDALERVGGGRVRADLILINQVNIPTDDVLKTARRIRQHSELPDHTPIVVMAEKFGVEMEGKDVSVGENEYVTYLEDADQLRNLLARLTS